MDVNALISFYQEDTDTSIKMHHNIALFANQPTSDCSMMEKALDKVIASSLVNTDAYKYQCHSL